MDMYTTEEQQLDAIRKWWKANGNSVLTGIVLAISIVLGWQLWKQNKQASGEAGAALYTQMIESAGLAWPGTGPPGWEPEPPGFVPTRAVTRETESKAPATTAR